MFGVTLINSPCIRLASEFAQELRKLHATHQIAYAALYISPGTAHQAAIRYVRNHDHLLQVVEQLEETVASMGDFPFVTDWFAVEWTEETADMLERMRGIFEYSMGFYYLNEPDLVPLENVEQEIQALLNSGGDLDTYLRQAGTAFTQDERNAQDHAVIAELLESIKGKKPDDFDTSIN